VEVGATAPDRARLEREGLPPGYRMRADAHYVDQLASRRAVKSHLDEPRPAARDADATSRDAVEAREARDAQTRRTERLLARLTESLATIDSAAALLSNEVSPTARRVNIDVIRMHVWRERWLLRTHALLHGVRTTHARPRPLGFVLDQIRTGFAPECRLTGVGLQVHASDWNAVVAIDESNLVVGVAGAIFATLALIDGAEGAAVTVRATSAGRELRSIEVAQDAVVVSASVVARFFDGSWTERPGGWTATWAALAVQAAARHHGGEATFLQGPAGGSTIRLQVGMEGLKA
jgi:hypothetical protein